MSNADHSIYLIVILSAQLMPQSKKDYLRQSSMLSNFEKTMLRKLIASWLEDGSRKPNDTSLLNTGKMINACNKDTRWTASSKFGTYSLCEQRRFRRACASAQSRQNLRCSLIQAVNQEEPSDRKPDPWPLWMARHAQLKFVMTECSKTQIRLTGLRYSLKLKPVYSYHGWIHCFQGTYWSSLQLVLTVLWWT